MAERAFESLRQAILSGALRPGERLPIEELSTASGMSRTPIREALAELARVGLVEIRPRHTAYVAELSLEVLKDVYDVRMSLEVAAISLAAMSFDDNDRASAAWWLERLRRALGNGESATAIQAHSSFHFALYRANTSRWLKRLLDLVWDVSQRYLLAAVGTEGVLLQVRIGEHAQLLSACESGESDLAAAVLWNHLADTANTISKAMGGAQLYDQQEPAVPCP